MYIIIAHIAQMREVLGTELEIGQEYYLEKQ
jgi:hypothetical protein